MPTRKIDEPSLYLFTKQAFANLAPLMPGGNPHAQSGTVRVLYKIFPEQVSSIGLSGYPGAAGEL
jgi:hypothetical protein